MKQKIELRPHHLFSLSLFEGKGYSEIFIQNMKEILSLLPTYPIQLVKGADAVCACCTHKGPKGCLLGEEDVKKRDKMVLEKLKCAFGEVAPKDIIKGLRLLKEEEFAACCSSCRWAKEGVCNYKKINPFVFVGKDLEEETDEKEKVLPLD